MILYLGIFFLALMIGMPVALGLGMASLVIQTQAFFTLLLAAPALRERARPHHWVGLSVAALGLAVIAGGRGEGPGQMTMVGFVLTLILGVLLLIGLCRMMGVVLGGSVAAGFLIGIVGLLLITFLISLGLRLMLPVLMMLFLVLLRLLNSLRLGRLCLSQRAVMRNLFGIRLLMILILSR